MAERQLLMVNAQQSLAPLGTCWRVGMLACRIEERDGRFEGGEGVGEGDGGSEVGGDGEEEMGTPLGEGSVDGALEGGAEEAGEMEADPWPLGEWLRERVFLQLPESPGRQHEQGLPLRTQEHLRHFAVPLQRQQASLRARMRIKSRQVIKVV